MKASVITLHTSSNYGSCLQAWATQQVLEKLGWEPELVDYCRPNSRPEALVEAYFSRAPLNKLSVVWDNVPPLKSMARAYLQHRVAEQSAPFERFRKQYLRLSRSYPTYEDLLTDPPRADVYITGSDQVWNSVWNGGFEPAMFLAFAPATAPKIAFSASIGRESIDDDEAEVMREALSSYNTISLRESSGVKIVRDLGRVDAVQVLDPTLLIDKSGWQEIATVPKGLPKEYLLTYQLVKSEVFFDKTRQLAKELDLPVVALCHAKGVKDSDAINIVSPEVTDYLGLFMNASYAVADSFHATAFSINFNVPFSIVLPDRFGTRIHSMLTLTGLEDRLMDSSVLSAAAGSMDFSRANAIIARERQASLTFLKDALADVVEE